MGIQSSWTIVLSMLSRILGMVVLQGCLLGPGNQDTNVDLLVQRMTDVLQNHFSLKPKNQGHVYTPPFPEWYHRVVLPNKVKVPTEFTKFSGQDDTSTVGHIALPNAAWGSFC
jgi:hypothetical protein